MSSNLSRYTPKQIEKYQRQKYLAFLDKISKNLFRIFRQEDSTVEQYCTKFDELKLKFDELDEIRLDSEYMCEAKEYIDRLYLDRQDIDEERFAQIKSLEMSNLNRLMKLKNRTTYKKDKHKNRDRDQDWG